MRVRAIYGGLIDLGHGQPLKLVVTGDEFDVPDDVGHRLVDEGSVFRVDAIKDLGSSPSNKALDQAPENKGA